MTHPNCTPSYDMRTVCDAAKKAAERNTEWTTHPASRVHGVRGRANHKIVEFRVTFGGGTYRYYLSSAGVLFSCTSDGFIPIELATYDASQLNTIRRVLDTIAT